MASMLKKIFAPVALGAAILGLAGCESAPDVAAKPAVIQQMVDNSLSVCQPGAIHGDSAAYAQRLTHMLSTSYTSSMKTLLDHHVTVCLDQRLMNQKTEFWGGGSVDGVFYANKDGGGVMTYVDNGRQPGESFWNDNPAYYRGNEAVDVLASTINAGKAPAQGLMQAQEWGKYHHVYWDPANMKPNSALSLNLQFQQPPVKAPMAKPGV